MLERFDTDIVNDVLTDFITCDNPDQKEEKVEELRSELTNFIDEHEMEWLDAVESKFDMDAPIDDEDFKEEYIATINRTKKELTDNIELIESVIEFLESDVAVDNSELLVVDVMLEIVSETPSDELIDVVLI